MATVKKSMKLRNITKIRNKIIQMIDENQEIKRLIKYLTSTPLESQGYDKVGTLVQQPNIEDSFINTNIYPISFTDDVLKEEQVKIFIHRLKGDLRDSDIGNNTIAIDIITPSKYIILEGENADRNTELAIHILDLIDNEVISSIGKVRIVYYDEGKVSNGINYNVLSLYAEIKTLNGKV